MPISLHGKFGAAKEIYNDKSRVGYKPVSAPQVPTVVSCRQSVTERLPCRPADSRLKRAGGSLAKLGA
jgi:hypothetical protein